MIAISEILETLIGEEPCCGYPCTLIRISGCNLDCEWCDTPRKNDENEVFSIDDIVKRVEKNDREWVLLTGGEPLLCDDSIELMRMLIEKGFKILLETNGSMPLDKVPKTVVKSVDFKVPSSGHAGSFLPWNLVHMNAHDYVKFVVADNKDIDYAIEQIKNHRLENRTNILFSPVYGVMDPAYLAKIILEKRIPARLSLQIHKMIGIK